ncbi:MAG: hypothetical protein V4538_11995 [Bacteroidota bacterium]
MSPLKKIQTLLLIGLVGFSYSTLTGCKSKKCPDFTQVDTHNRIDKHGLVKKKRVKQRSNPQGY